MSAARATVMEGKGQAGACAPAPWARQAEGLPHSREGIIAPTSPAVRVRITVIRTPQVGFAGANRSLVAEAMSNGGRLSGRAAGNPGERDDGSRR
jgi:hypothetical protein